MQDIQEKLLVCPMCGKTFKGCRTCSDKNLISWKTVTDTEDCFKLFSVLHKYFVRHESTKDEAKKELEKLTLLESYPEHIQAQIDELKGVVKKEEQKTTEPVKIQHEKSIKK